MIDSTRISPLADTTRPDTPLLILNLSPYITQSVDSVLTYPLELNKPPKGYHWYLKNAPVGLSIGRDNGIIGFRAAKNYFQSGKLKYDFPYRVGVVAQNALKPADKVDTSFVIQFFNTEIIPTKVKPSVGNLIHVEEGQALDFKVQCETGSFPFDEILFSSSVPLSAYSLGRSCEAEFKWQIPYTFVSEHDSAKVKLVTLVFTGINKFGARDSAQVRVVVHDALNYDEAKLAYQQTITQVNQYILQLKYAFLVLDKKIRGNKTARTSFDLAAASTALSGTVLTTSASTGAQNAGKILPGIGVALVPVKEAASPQKTVEQNQASLVRSTIRRLEYMMSDNQLVGDKDEQIVAKTAKLKDELRQARVQLIDIPVEIDSNMSAAELDKYFNSPKVNKKYRLKRGG